MLSPLQEWSSGIVFNPRKHQESKSTAMVNVIRLSKFILSIVAKRRLPEAAFSKAPTVVMKMDIEGKQRGFSEI